jgi:peptidoglycan/LPS O-acetylase OafA/YrhL
MNDFIAIPAITVLCYLAAELYKAFMPEVKYRHIPLLCGLAGLSLGVVCYYTLPGYIPAENWLVASAIGAVSGWAATGANQTVKQEGKSVWPPKN